MIINRLSNITFPKGRRNWNTKEDKNKGYLSFDIILGLYKFCFLDCRATMIRHRTNKSKKGHVLK